MIEAFLPDGRKVVNLYSLILDGASLESFVGKTCYIPDFQVGIPPGKVRTAWTVGQIRDLEIETLGAALDDEYDPAEADRPSFTVGVINAFDLRDEQCYTRVLGEGFDKGTAFVWVDE